MCTGVAIAGLAAAAAGSASTFVANKNDRKKRDSISESYRTRNLINQGKADSEAALAAKQYEPGNIQDLLAQSEADRNAALPVEAAPDSDNLYAGAAPDGLKKDISRKIVESVDKGKKEAQATSKLNSISDALFTNNLGNIDSGRQISGINSNVAGDSRTADFELSQAGRGSEGLRTVADVFNFGGQAASLYGATGVPKPFKSSWTPNSGTPSIPTSSWLSR